MRAIEFDAVIDGGTIRIPARYVDEVGRVARVILLADTAPTFPNKPYNKEDFSELRIPTKGWKFDREEANER